MPPCCHARVSRAQSCLLLPDGHMAPRLSLQTGKLPITAGHSAHFSKKSPILCRTLQSTFIDAKKSSWLPWGSNLLPDTAPCSFAKLSA